MSRGPRPLKAKEAALPVAERRGLVQRYQHRRGNICDFSIMSPGLVRFVCTVRLILLSSKPEDILHDYAKVIGQLRFIASSPAISRELWLHTPHGAWRFFRILDDSNIELDCHGIPLANGTGPVNDRSTAANTGREAGHSTGQKSVTSGQDAAGKKTDRVKNSLPGPSGNPGKDPAPVFNPTNNPAPDSAAISAPAPSPAPENYPVPATETEDAQPTGINLELIRRFMRWRKERQKKGSG
jgi:hypothetical protein